MGEPSKLGTYSFRTFICPFDWLLIEQLLNPLGYNWSLMNDDETWNNKNNTQRRQREKSKTNR